jgi:hypothetical protein
MTQPPFILLPDTKAFWEIAASDCWDGNRADVNLVGVVADFVGAAVSDAAAGMAPAVSAASESTLGSSATR